MVEFLCLNHGDAFLFSSSMAIAMSFLHTSEGKQMLQSNLGHARIILLELGEGMLVKVLISFLRLVTSMILFRILQLFDHRNRFHCEE